MNLLEAVTAAIEEFNRLHGSEATARLVRIEGERFTVEFRGSFCVTCGFYDYFEDLVYILAEKGFRAGIVSVEEVEDGGIVEYRLLKPGESWRFVPEKQILILE
ncbi:MAG: hypothetical protein ACP5IE_09385 [Infirmifilum sp.]